MVEMLIGKKWEQTYRRYHGYKCLSDEDLKPCDGRRNTRFIMLNRPLMEGTSILGSDGRSVYVKLGNEYLDWWVSTDSTYPHEVYRDGKLIHYEPRPESDKPLYNKEGKLNRFGFRWTDLQILNNYPRISFQNS